MHSTFSHFPGLKVVIPTSPYDAKGLLASSINDPNPVLFLEHRWLHNLTGLVPKKRYFLNHSKSKLLKKGSDLTIVSTSYMTQEVKSLYNDLKKNKISVDHLDLISIKPIDSKNIIKSVKKTGRLLVLDTGFKTNSISSFNHSK